MAACLLASCAGVDPRRALEAAVDYRPLPHRLETVARTPGGVEVVNDSKATNLDSVRAALDAFRGRPLVLLLGGKDKGASWSSLIPCLEGVAAVMAFGAAAKAVEGALAGCLTVESFPSLRPALERALACVPGNGVVLLSPGCASFDEFRDFRHRGECFTRWAREWLEKQHGP